MAQLFVTVAPLTPDEFTPVVVGVVAPQAEAADAARLSAVLATCLGRRVAVRKYLADTTEGLGGAVCKAIAEGCDVVAPVGGDEALVVAARAAAVGGAVVLPIPLGTTAALARGVGHRTLADVVAALDRGRVQPMDLARCRYRGADGRPRETAFFAEAGGGLLTDLRRERKGHAFALDEVAEGLQVLVRRTAARPEAAAGALLAREA